VVLWLTVEGVRLALDGYANRIRAGQEPPVDRLHAQFIEKGGRFYVCPICFSDRQLDESDLVQNAELQGATPLMDFAGHGARRSTTEELRAPSSAPSTSTHRQGDKGQ
jgi:uncharacterized protein